MTLANLNRLKEAEATMDRALAILIKTTTSRRARQTPIYSAASCAASPDERPRRPPISRSQSRSSRSSKLEPGHLAGAKFTLAQVLWPADKARAKLLATDAIGLFENASPSWAPQLAEARVWLDSPQ